MGSYESGEFSTGYIDPTDIDAKNLKQMMDHFYQSHYTINASQWMQSSIDRQFKAGDQGLGNQIYGSGYQKQQKYFFNLIRRHSNMIVGFQRRNRKSTVAMPTGNDDDQIADDYNKVLRWCDDRDGYQEYQSQAFEGAVDTGESLLHLYADYTFDPVSGDLFTDFVSCGNYLIDSQTRKQDFSDCNGIWRRRWTSKAIAKSMLPGYASEIDKMRAGGHRDGRFPIQSELQNNSVDNAFTYDEFFYRTTRPGKIILDTMTGEATEWNEDETAPEDELDQILSMQPWLKAQNIEVPTVKQVISLGGKIVYHGRNQLSIDQYPFVPLQCYVDQDLRTSSLRKQGIIRGLRDAQFLYNMRKIIELQLLQSSLNAGWIYPVDVVTDAKCFRQSSGGDGFLIPLKAGHTAAEIQRIEPVGIPQSLIELSNSLAEDITKISGVNEELLGSATDDKSGILSMLRQGAGLTTLQTIFDKLDYSQRLFGKIRLAAIRKNFSKGKIRNILGHDADDRFFTSHAQKYAIAVEEGNYSGTQRQTELQQMLHFRELGIPIPDKSILRAAFLTNKKQIIDDMQEESQAQAQAQQQQAQMQAEMDNAKIMSIMSKTQLDSAKEAEIAAKIDDLEASAEHKGAQADLEMVRTMIELEDLDLANFRSNLDLAVYLKDVNKQNQLGPTLAIGG